MFVLNTDLPVIVDADALTILARTHLVGERDAPPSSLPTRGIRAARRPAPVWLPCRSVGTSG